MLSLKTICLRVSCKEVYSLLAKLNKRPHNAFLMVSHVVSGCPIMVELVETRGIEPPTFSLRTRRSPGLSYVPTES